MTTPKILILGASKENTFYIDALLNLADVNVVCVDKNPTLDATFVNSHKDKLKCISLDFSDLEAVSALVLQEQITHTIALPVGRSLTILGMINDKFGFAGPSYHAINTLTDKVKFHELCSKLTIPQASYLVLDNGSDKSIAQSIDLIESKLSYPLIFKPAFGSGSLGVKFISNKQDLLQYRTPERFVEHKLLVEQVIKGVEYSTNFFIDDLGLIHIIGIFKKECSPYPYCQEIAYFIDDFSTIANIVEPVISKIAQTLKLRQSFLHADIIIKDNLPYIIDTSARLTGNNVIKLFNFINHNPIKTYINHVLGAQVKEQVDSTDNKAKTSLTGPCAALRFFNFNLPIVYGSHSASFNEDLASLNVQSQPNIKLIFTQDEQDHILEYENNLALGSTYGPMTSGMDTIRGYIFTCGKSIDEANNLCYKYLKAVQDY